MALKRSLLAAGMATTLGVATVAGVSAQGSEGFSGVLSEKLATEFNLNEEEVRSFLEETREELQEERQAEREAAYTQKLEDAVAAGTITEEQKERILDFHAEQQTAREELKNIEDDEERREAHKQLRDAFKAFMEENSDIPFEELRPEGGEGKRGRRGAGAFNEGDTDSIMTES